MENINLPDNRYRTEKVTYLDQHGTKVIAKSFMANVFMLMALALVISGVTAYVFAGNRTFMASLVTPTGGVTGMGLLVMLSPIAIELVMQLGYRKLSTMTLGFLFAVLSVLLGMSLSFIFLVYTASSIAICFFSSAGMFGVMAVMGYTTKKDLTSFGRLLYMAFIGIFVSCIINFFLHSDSLGYFIGLIGTLVFTGLTAYYVQKIKQMGEALDMDDPSAMKVAILGALLLYLTFINLFISLLRIFGNRR